MNLFNLSYRYYPITVGALFASLLALLSACSSSDDKRPLVLVSVPLGAYASPDNMVELTVAPVVGASVKQSVNANANATGSFGIYLPSGTSGSATVSVSVRDVNGCVIATGGPTAVQIKPGETTPVVSIPLKAATAPCGADGGTSDDAMPLPADTGGGPQDILTLPTDAKPLGSESGLPDVLPASPDASDGSTSGIDVSVLPLLDANPDRVTPSQDGPVDAPAAETSAPDVASPDTRGDGAASVLSLLNNCKSYTHTLKDSSGKPTSSAVRPVFTPDGKALISFGDDGRAKVWNVTAAGLEEPSNSLIFTGDRKLVGAVSSDGNALAVGENNNVINIYDLPLSLKNGVASPVTSLISNTFSPKPNGVNRLWFTSDNRHVIALYVSKANPDPNLIVVWDLDDQTMVQYLEYEFVEWPMAVQPGAYTDSILVASAIPVATDGGSVVSRVSLVNVTKSAARPTVQFTVPNDVYRMAFSPDGSTLAIGDELGEVGLWDITNKANIVRLGSPLIEGSPTSYFSVSALTYTKDGKYLAAGISDDQTSTVSLLSLQPRLSIQINVDSVPISLAFSPDSSSLAVGKLDGGTLLFCKN